MNAKPIRKEPEPDSNGQANPELDIRDEYDFRGGVRGKYVHRLPGGIRREMFPAHAREMWDVESTTHGELPSRPGTQAETD